MEKISKSQKGRKHRVIGIDLGTKDLATLSNGIKIKEHPSLTRLRFNLHKLESRLLRQKPNSIRYRETIRVIHRTKQRIQEAEQDHSNKLAKFLTSNYRIICIEGKSSSDKSPNQNWEILRATLRKKCKEVGRTYIEVKPYLTTQTCSKCGRVQKIPKEERMYRCPQCGLQLDRDIMAANNIRNWGIKKLSR